MHRPKGHAAKKVPGFAARVTLVLGGARSGKSSYAQRLAESLFKKPLYLAVAEARDSEMADRIRRHRRRRGSRWQTHEEPLAIAQAIVKAYPRCDGVLLECATIWLSNVMLAEGRAAIARRKRELMRALRMTARPVIVVANEVGMGVVPPTPLGRDFRDEAGWLNQELAAAADCVVLVIAGLPTVLKGTLPCAD